MIQSLVASSVGYSILLAVLFSAEQQTIVELKKIGAKMLYSGDGGVLSITYAGRMSDDSLKSLRLIPGLRQVIIDPDCNVTDDSMKQLGQIASLQVLYIKGEQPVTDKGLEHLKACSNLKTLMLIQVREITDSGLRHLEGLQKLRLVSVPSSKVTAAGAAQLMNALPDVRVQFSK